MSHCWPFHFLFHRRRLCALAFALWALTLALPLLAQGESGPRADDVGFFRGSHAGLKLRSYNDYLNIKGQP